jgi:hypothetical protein
MEIRKARFREGLNIVLFRADALTSTSRVQIVLGSS